MTQILGSIALQALGAFLRALLGGDFLAHIQALVISYTTTDLPGDEKAARVRAEAKAALAAGTVAANQALGWAVGLAIEYGVARTKIAEGALR